MRKFVTYINLYDQSNYKLRNVGFARFIMQGEKCDIEVHIQKSGLMDQTCKLYLYKRENEEMLSVHVGDISLKNGENDIHLEARIDTITDNEIRLSEIEGMLFLTEEGYMVASQWEDGKLGREYISEWKKHTENNTPENYSSADMDYSEKEIDADVKQNNSTDELSDTDAKDNTLTGQSLVFEVPEDYDKSVELWEEYELQRPFPNVPDMECVKIQLKDLRKLQKKYWYLGNNNFLVRGFHNYRYLWFGRQEEEKYILGVPGVYQEQERVLATIFGFSEFASEVEGEVSIGTPGCWYRRI